MEGIPLTFPGVQAPNRDTVHDILGKLIRERKIYCTGKCEFFQNDTNPQKYLSCPENAIHIRNTKHESKFSFVFRSWILLSETKDTYSEKATGEWGRGEQNEDSVWKR